MKDMREKLDKYKGRATITAAGDGRIEEVICTGINKVGPRGCVSQGGRIHAT